MTHQYNITGMTCGSCVAKAKSALLMLGDVTEAEVALNAPQASVTMQKHIPLSVLQTALSKAGNYTITEAQGTHMIPEPAAREQGATWPVTYKPILLIGAYLLASTLLIESVHGGFALERWMQNFMTGFFLVFSFFKLLDVRAFADSYATYDVIAKRWRAWGVIYPFVELALGVAFLTGLHPLLVNGVAFVVMGVSMIGVLQSVLAKRKIQCACLGAVFNLPMSTVTIIEDALMIAMSAAMIVELV